MEVKATYKYARISPLKARDVVREVTGLPVSSALDVLRFTPKKAAFLVSKTLKSAIANAENNHDLSAEDLIVKSATVGDGPAFKRWKPRARGGAAPIRKRTAHINIILTDEVPEALERKAAAAETAQPKKAPAKKTVAKKTAGTQTAKTEEKADDLKKISGIGPKIEEKLNDLGIRTYADLAALDEEQVEELGERISAKDRLSEWVEEARKLEKKGDAE